MVHVNLLDGPRCLVWRPHAAYRCHRPAKAFVLFPPTVGDDGEHFEGWVRPLCTRHSAKLRKKRRRADREAYREAHADLTDVPIGEMPDEARWALMSSLLRFIHQ